MIDDCAIIIPVAPGDDSWTGLARDLAALPAGPEILFTGPKPPAARERLDGSLSGERHRVAWIRSPLGRARQMNLAARATRRRFLWFLHADSRLEPAALVAMGRSFREAPESLHYFDLCFGTREMPLMALSNAGVWLRSHLLGLPFGDQGLALSRDRFLGLGGYDETARYGEDHLLVWAARRAGVPLRCTGEILLTSARKYEAHGWLRTTARHQALTIRQALPEAIRLLRRRPS